MIQGLVLWPFEDNTHVKSIATLCGSGGYVGLPGFHQMFRVALSGKGRAACIPMWEVLGSADPPCKSPGASVQASGFCNPKPPNPQAMLGISRAAKRAPHWVPTIRLKSKSYPFQIAAPHMGRTRPPGPVSRAAPAHDVVGVLAQLPLGSRFLSGPLSIQGIVAQSPRSWP